MDEIWCEADKLYNEVTTTIVLMDALIRHVDRFIYIVNL